MNDIRKNMTADITRYDTLHREDRTTRTHLDTLEERFPLHEQNENAGICSGMTYSSRNPARTVAYDDISETEIDGFPIHVFRREDGRLHATFSPDTHAMIVGSTGSGKTTGFVLPFLNWMSAKKNKPGIVVSDPKNELSRATLNRFRQNGYHVVWLNFQDYALSDCWNPLTKIYRLYQQYLTVEDTVTVTRSKTNAYNKFQGRVYKRQAELDMAILAEKDRLLAEVDNMIGSIADSVSPVEKNSDPYWEQRAATFFRAFLWAMLEDSAPDKTEGRITEETYSFDTLIKIYDTFTDGHGEINDQGYFSKRDPATSKAYQLAFSGIIDLTANVTRSCIISNFSEKLQRFRDTSVRRVTCANTIDMESLDDGDHPTVIFISYKDEDSLHYGIISMFISDLYTSLIGTARRKGGALSRPFYFLLDEFGNFPRFTSFENVISACRSRNVWFFLIIQSYAQLDRVYEKATAAIIKDNLNMHIFFGSCNYETKKAFSEECGRREIISPLSAINGTGPCTERYEKELVPLIPVSKLSTLTDGECIITQMRGDVIMSRLERSYLCPEYDVGVGNIADREAPIPFFNGKYTYDVAWLLGKTIDKHRFDFG